MVSCLLIVNMNYIPNLYVIARLVDENLMLVVFGLGSDGKGLKEVSLLDTSTWNWVPGYQPNLSWLTGNVTFVPSSSQGPTNPTSLLPSNVTFNDNSTMPQPHSLNQSVQASTGQSPIVGMYSTIKLNDYSACANRSI